MKIGERGMVAVMLLAMTGFATESSDWAEREFREYTEKIFGNTPQVEFLLPGTTEDFADDFKALKDTDGYAVRKRKGKICFIADCVRGHVNGVHRWLERNSDIVWPRPAKGLAIYTPQPNADLEKLDCDYRDIPAFKLRFHGGKQGDAEFYQYLVRNSVSPSVNNPECYGRYCEIFGNGHDMETYWFPVKEFYTQHPEYWAMIDGERKPRRSLQHGYPTSQFCETNPNFCRDFCKSVEAKIANLPPEVKLISINIEDSADTCQCEECMKPITLEDGSTIDSKDRAFKSTRFFKFFNQVAKHVEKVRPGTKILQYAYWHLAEPPKVKMERNIVLKYCPYPRNMRESVLEGSTNEKFRNQALGWLENTPSLYWREYYFCQCVYFPRPIADTAVTDLRILRNRGVEYVYSDAAGYHDTAMLTNRISIYHIRQPYSEHWDMCAGEVWTINQLLWNPSLDPERLRAEFNRRTFGLAAKEIDEFYRLLRESWYQQNFASAYNDEGYDLAAEFIVDAGISEKCRDALSRAFVKADTEVRKKWIKAMSDILERWIYAANNERVKMDPSHITFGENTARVMVEGDEIVVRSKLMKEVVLCKVMMVAIDGTVKQFFAKNSPDANGEVVQRIKIAQLGGKAVLKRLRMKLWAKMQKIGERTTYAHWNNSQDWAPITWGIVDLTNINKEKERK